jgi:hypothetical protein
MQLIISKEINDLADDELSPLIGEPRYHQENGQSPGRLSKK